MALGMDMQVIAERCDYVNPFQVERGGILSLSNLSGVTYAVYEPNPTADTIPLGLMMHDQEEVDLFRAIAPWSSSRKYPEYTPYPYLIKGEIVTNAIHPDVTAGMIIPGAPAYLAPSGLITTAPTYNPRKIGQFLSTLNDPRLGLSSFYTDANSMRVAGSYAIVDPRPTLVPTAGWAKIHISIRN